MQSTIEDRLSLLLQRWDSYAKPAHNAGQIEQFVEFTIAVNSLTEHFNILRLPGLMRLCEGLENAALDKLDDVHPIAQQDIEILQRQIDALTGSVATLRPSAPDKRTKKAAAVADNQWIKPRSVWVVSALEKREMAEALSRQLEFFGFKTSQHGWEIGQIATDMPLAVLFIPSSNDTKPEELACIANIRDTCPPSQLIYLGDQSSIEPIVALMRTGIDVTIPVEEQPARVLNCILDLVQSNEQEKSRVLIVEDSRVATTVIQRTLTEHGIDTHAISDPGELLNVLESYRPDLILMDMYMPRFNGVEATRVLRQMEAYSSLPIVYVSGESEVGMQVEALRLGGDQFLIKPFNPVLLAAVVKTKIERYREAQRSSRMDGLTGLLNHTAVKSQLKIMVDQIATHQTLTVAMIDIDHFKSVNDTYGHPVGDQVIRSLAWLLKGHLRSNDLIGRYGGEEFLIALPGISAEQAELVIDRIRGDFAALPHAHSNGSLYCSFSAGVASYDINDTADSLTEAADSALLEAKRNGRNRVGKAKLAG
ncbi:MAG: GGDEF domain-containing protein [Methylophilaceae bacterium]